MMHSIVFACVFLFHRFCMACTSWVVLPEFSLRNSNPSHNARSVNEKLIAGMHEWNCVKRLELPMNTHRSHTNTNNARQVLILTRLVPGEVNFSRTRTKLWTKSAARHFITGFIDWCNNRLEVFVRHGERAAASAVGLRVATVSPN